MAKQKTSPVAVIGALAYDQISHTQGHFTGTTEPLLNCKLEGLVETFGGCGGNIAYNLANLGCDVQLISATGVEDDQRYVVHLASLGIQIQSCLRVAENYTARALIITDQDGHQFTGFYPGPQLNEVDWHEHLCQLNFHGCRLFVQAPYPPSIMVASLKFAANLDSAPLRICCPGQYADQLSPTEARDLIAQCDWLVGNHYEIEHLRPYLNHKALVIIETNGADSVKVHFQSNRQGDDCGNSTYLDAYTFDVPSVTSPVDPTGCGDAFLAGLAYGLSEVAPQSFIDNLPAAIDLGIKTASSCIRYKGAQYHFQSTSI